jgi:hypothetical protein
MVGPWSYEKISTPRKIMFVPAEKQTIFPLIFSRFVGQQMEQRTFKNVSNYLKTNCLANKNKNGQFSYS